MNILKLDEQKETDVERKERIKQIQDICNAPYRKKQMDSKKQKEESEFERRFKKEQAEMEKTKRCQEKEERYQEFKKKHI